MATSQNNSRPQDDDLLVNLAHADTPAIIQVIGVGGGGCNAVAQMYREGIPGIQLLACNTDSKSLETSPLPNRLQLGPGLGAGGRPELGRQYAEESVEQIRASFGKNVQMVFITAGMGGGTGTGASPVIAREARKKGLLTVGIVTLPFLFERERRIDKALDGLEAMAAEVDAMLVINNERLMDIYPTQSVIAAFRKADETLTVAVRSIVEIINMHGRIILDFRDVYVVLKDGGVAVISSGYGEGENRIAQAIRNALYSPLLNNNDVYRSRRLVFSITVASEEGPSALRVEEMNAIYDFTSRFHGDIETKWGLSFDPELGDRVKITILASGFSLYGNPPAAEVAAAPETSGEEEREERRATFYAEARQHKHSSVLATRPKIYLFSMEDLSNEFIVSLVDNVPTRTRTTADLQRMVNQAASPRFVEEQEESGDNVIYFDEQNLK